MEHGLCDCCVSLGQWFAEHIDPSGLVRSLQDFPITDENVRWVNELGSRPISASELRRARDQYLAQR